MMTSPERRTYAVKRLKKLYAKLADVEFGIRTTLGEERERFRKAKRSVTYAINRWFRILQE
jgi:hypothetical protein